MGEDKDEEEVEGAKEAPTQAKPNKIKAKAQPMARTKATKITNPSLEKKTTPTTRARTWPPQKRPRRKPKSGLRLQIKEAKCRRNKEGNTLHNLT